MSCKESQMTERMFDFYGEQEMMRQCWVLPICELVKPDYGLIKLYLGRNLMHVKRGYLGKKYGYSGKNITG